MATPLVQLERRRLARAANVPEPTLVGESRAWREVVALAYEVAREPITVVILGESGTGKTELARLIHARSDRSSGPFILGLCGALTPSLQEAELFGHERGAFTGATDARPGWFELADGGTLLLDEVGHLLKKPQRTVLHVVEGHGLLRIRGTSRIYPDIRYIVTAKRTLQQLVRARLLLPDLMWRLDGFEIRLPPLRERLEDIVLLVEHYLAFLANAHGRECPAVSAAVYDLFHCYRWPGNVRELHSVLDMAMILAKDGVIELRHIKQRVVEAVRDNQSAPRGEAARKARLEAALRASNGRLEGAARILGRCERTMRRWVKELGVDVRRIRMEAKSRKCAL